MSAIVVKPGYSLAEAQAIMLVSTDEVQRGLANSIISLHAANQLMTEMLEKADVRALAISTQLRDVLERNAELMSADVRRAVETQS